MADKFYDFEHQCDKMPTEVDGICKLKGSSLSQMTMHHYIPQVGSMQTTLYGFNFCPYCGENLEANK